MHAEMNPLVSKAELQRAWVAIQLNEHIDDPMHFISSKNNLLNYRSNATLWLGLLETNSKKISRREMIAS